MDPPVSIAQAGNQSGDDDVQVRSRPAEPGSGCMPDDCVLVRERCEQGRETLGPHPGQGNGGGCAVAQGGAVTEQVFEGRGSGPGFCPPPVKDSRTAPPPLPPCL